MNTDRISLTLALDAIKEIQNEVEESVAYTARLREERNELILDALDKGISVTRMMRVTGLSRDGIQHIKDRGMRE